MGWEMKKCRREFTTLRFDFELIEIKYSTIKIGMTCMGYS